MIKNATSKQMDSIYELYMEAFPEDERKPFNLIKQKAREGKMEILAIMEQEEFVGLAITILYHDMVLIDYFAMHKAYRGQGLGGKAIEELKECYKNKRLFLEIEILDEKAENYQERVRRKAFYLNHGLTEAKIYVVLFGVEMELLTVNCPMTFEEYLSVYVETFGDSFKEKVKLA